MFIHFIFYKVAPGFRLKINAAFIVMLSKCCPMLHPQQYSLRLLLTATTNIPPFPRPTDINRKTTGMKEGQKSSYYDFVLDKPIQQFITPLKITFFNKIW